MSIKKLASVHDKFIISLEHKLDPVPAIKATVTIPGENNTYVKKVSTLFENGDTIEKAEANALNKAISLLLGNKLTSKLAESFEMFDISFSEITAKNGILIKANIVSFKDKAPFRQVSSISGSEEEALKSAINKILGVR
jgi:hypothetical protein